MAKKYKRKAKSTIAKPQFTCDKKVVVLLERLSDAVIANITTHPSAHHPKQEKKVKKRSKQKTKSTVSNLQSICKKEVVVLLERLSDSVIRNVPAHQPEQIPKRTAANIDLLPEEVLLKIFSYLTQNQLGQIARICKQWNKLTKRPVLWKKVHVEFSPSHESQSIVAEYCVKRLPSCVTGIRLDFTYCDDWTKPLNFEKLCMSLQESCPHLKILILKYAILSDTLPSIIDFCTLYLQKVQVLGFHYCLFPDCLTKEKDVGTSKVEILDISCCHLGPFNKPPFLKMPRLKKLRLSYTNVSNSWFDNDASFVDQLKVLDLGCTKITSRAFQAIQNHAFDLEELYLCYTEFKGGLNVNNSVFPSLKTICLRGCNVTSEEIASLVKSCQSLENVFVTEYVVQAYANHPLIVFDKHKLQIVKLISCGDHRIEDYLYEPI